MFSVPLQEPGPLPQVIPAGQTEGEGVEGIRKGGAIYGRRCAAAFETQYFPDAINKFNFEGGLLRAGEEFRSRTTYAFSAV